VHTKVWIIRYKKVREILIKWVTGTCLQLPEELLPVSSDGLPVFKKETIITDQ